MDACVRGFSYMPEKLETTDLKFVDSDALEQAWKLSRRERVKQQEQKIWEEFVQEQDVVTNICKDDPYQFIEQLSEEKIKELLEIELQKMREEKIEEDKQIQELSPKIEVKNENTQEENDNHHVVFIDDTERDDTLHIFDDEREGDVSGVSGPEDENNMLNDSMSPPCTVRERLSPNPGSRYPSPDKVSNSKSTENVTSMIESSIYCAKVKDLRIKMAAELDEIALALERQNIMNIDPADLPKMMQRSVEFTSRFNRIHMYQLHRQIQDIKRNSSQAPPFARHTQFQAQMVRVVSLHQNALHSAQVFMKSIPQTLCIRESGELLRSWLQAVRELSEVCGQVAAPAGLNAAKDLFQDGLAKSSEKLLSAIEEYATRMSDYLNSTDNTSVSQSRHSKRSHHGRKSIGSWSKSGTKSFGDTDAHLSMYSLDTLRHHSTAKVSSSKENQSSGTSKKRASLSGRSRVSLERNNNAPKRKKSPRARRPLMRDPDARTGAARPRRRAGGDHDVTTLVEAVAPCTSSHMSREASPAQSPTLKDIIPRKGKNSTPRSPKKEAKRLRKEPKTPRKSSRSPQKTPKVAGKELVTSDKEISVQEHKVEMVSPKTDAITPRKEAITPRKETDTTRKEVVMPKKDIVTPRNEQNTPRNHERTLRKESTTPRFTITPRQNQKTPREEPIPPSQLKTPQTTPRPKNNGNGEGERTREKELKDSSPRREDRRSDRDRKGSVGAGGCEVMTLLRQLCGGDSAGARNERVSGAKNAQLVCVNSTSPRQPSTPQLLRILEETIQKKSPRPLCPTPRSPRDIEKCRMTFNIPEKVSEELYQYRTKFVQHMLTSSMYANSAVGKPWEVIGRVSERIIDDQLLTCAKEMELQNFIRELYKNETS